MKHDKIQELLSAYLDKELDTDLTAQVDKHLQECEACRGELAALQQLEDFYQDIPQPTAKEEYWEALPTRIKTGIQEKMHTAPKQEGKMFKDSMIKADKNVGIKFLVFPFSLTLHAAIVLMMLILPLLNTGNLPQVEIYSAFLAPPPPPPPPWV